MKGLPSILRPNCSSAQLSVDACDVRDDGHDASNFLLSRVRSQGRSDETISSIFWPSWTLAMLTDHLTTTGPLEETWQITAHKKWY